jgi:glucokinase
VHLINDLVGLALGAVLAPKSKLRSLSGGSLPSKKGANIAILAAGTGLGEAALLWNGAGFLPMATEGGHTDLAARSETEVAFVRYLQKRYGRATYERALSGPGLGNTYDFVREAFGILEDPAVEGAIAGAKDRNAEICQLALAGRSLAAEKALEIFVELYGAEAGNLALKTFALGGVYVAGNIAIQIQEKMAQGTFLDAFCDKEPMKDILRKVPVALVLDSTIGLAGAAHHAAHTKIVA